MSAAVAASLVATAMVLASPGAAAPPMHPDADARRFVVLNAADPTLPAFVELDRGVRAAIAEGRSAPTRLYAETLDMDRFPEAQIDGEVLSLLRRKYAGLKVDAVVAAGDAALRFAQAHREEIWPRASIVFHSVSESELREAQLPSRTAGVPVRLDFGGAVDLALRLRPDSRRLVVVAGAADLDKRNLALVRESLERHAGKLDVEYLAGLTVAETVAAARAIPAGASVLYTTMFRDGAGDPLVPRDVLTRIVAASSAPVFGVYETYLGDGIVAGSIATYEAQGRRAGELVVRLLAGAGSRGRRTTCATSKTAAQWRSRSPFSCAAASPDSAGNAAWAPWPLRYRTKSTSR